MMPVHPAAELFPLMEGSEFDRLVESIRTNGFDADCAIVVTEDGQIIDGRNRWRACEQLGIEPRKRVYHGDDPFGEAVKLNVARRHLNSSQIAAIIVKSDAMRTAAIAAKRRQGARTDLNISPSRGESSGKASQKMAEEFGIGKSTLERVQRAEREAPELIPKIISGEMTSNAAERIVKERKEAQGPAQPSEMA